MSFLLAKKLQKLKWDFEKELSNKLTCSIMLTDVLMSCVLIYKLDFLSALKD